MKSLLQYVLLITVAVVLEAQAQNDSSVLTCSNITLAEPPRGVEYRGVVKNSDYRFSVRIPSGLAGWGAAPGAPFHGFSVFLNSAKTPARSSCIHVLVEQEVFLDEDSRRVAPGVLSRTVRIGNRQGSERTVVGLVQGIMVENRRVSLELSRQAYTNFLSVTLVTPSDERSRTEAIFRSFIASFNFW